MRRLSGWRGEEDLLIDVAQAYRNDLVPSLTHEPLRAQFWRDLNLDADWFASGAPPGRDGCQVEWIKASGSLPDKLAARPHSRYFDNQQVVRVLLGTP